MQLLVDRDKELGVLDEAWGSGRAELVLIYGRRRIGKTFLVRGWMGLRGIEGLYLVVNFEDPGPALADLEAQLAEALGFRPRLEGVRSLVALLSEYLCVGPRRLVVIDEFQRLARAGLPQLLQEAWDRRLRWCNGVLVLLGSSVGSTERVTASGGAPLYGRLTRMVRLGGFGFAEAYPMLRGAPSPAEAFTLYSAFGGSPYTLSLVDPQASVEENIYRLVTGPGAPLAEEPLLELLMETREPDRYLAILGAAARGAVRLTKIAETAGVPVQSVPKYLQTLESMGLVERITPVRSRRSLYRVADPFHRFWLRHIMPRRSMIELGMGRKVASIVARELGDTVAQTWEIEATRDALESIASRDSIREAGPWIHREEEVDMVVLGERNVWLVEAKWAELAEKDVERIAWRLRSLAETRKPLTYAEPRIIIYAAEAPRPNLDWAEVVTLQDMARRASTTPTHKIPGEETPRKPLTTRHRGEAS